MTDKQRETHGFGYYLWRFKGSLLAGDLFIAILLTGIGYRLACGVGAEDVRSLLELQIGASAALFGIVIAGLAIIAAFLSPQVVQLLGRKPGAVEKTFFHFWFVTFLAIANLLVAFFGILATHQWSNEAVRHIAITASTFVFAYMLTSTFWLVGFIVNRAITTAMVVAAEDE